MLIQSLDLETEWMDTLLKQDEKTMKSFGIACYAIKNGKYKNDKRKQRLKLQAVKNQFLDAFIANFLKRKSIVVSIIVKGIQDYWTNQPSEYDKLMKELDLILSTPLIYDKENCQEDKGKSQKFENELYNKERKRDCPSGCRNIEYGICFCRTDSGEYYY